MHQVRVHLADAGTPVAGDALYGGTPLPGLIGHFLHAARLELHHPTTGATLVIEAPLPPDRLAALDAARAL
jgi:23S rRNA-/tRNA-specific pseudouridylate synthase